MYPTCVSSKLCEFICYKVTAVFVRGLFSKGEVRTEGEQPADQVSVDIINL